MRITQRQVAIGLQVMILIGLVGLAIYQIVAGSPLFATVMNIIGVIVTGALLGAYLRQWRYAPQLILIISIVFSSLVPPPPLFGIDTVLSLLIPPVTALILGTPAWVAFSAIATLALFAARSSADIPSNPPFYILY